MLAFDVAYHGQYFSGWHRQQSADGSVQATLERAVSACLRSSGASMEDVRLNALTDIVSAKGAHSRGQLCFFRATPEALAKAQGSEPELDLPVPSSIVAGPLRTVGTTWPRPLRLRAAYFIQQGRPVRELAPFAWYVREVLHPLALQRAAAVLQGTHDLSPLSRSSRGGRARTKSTIECAQVTLLPATVEAFDLRHTLSGSSPEEVGVVSQDARSSWLLRVEVQTAEGCGNLPSQFMQRLAALLRYVATSRDPCTEITMDEQEELAKKAERTLRAVLDGSSYEAEALPVAPARGIWLEEVALQCNNPCSITSCSDTAEDVRDSSAAVEPPAKRASTGNHCSDGVGGSLDKHSADIVSVHTISARILLTSTIGPCWVGPTKPGSQRLRASDYERLVQLRPESSGADRQHVVVGVNSAALPQFFSKIWPHVHPNVRCVILSADSDWGVPGEVWAKNKQLCAQGETSTPGLLPSLRDVLEDPRLVSWFTQNYDFGFGCHLDIARSCSSDPHSHVCGSSILEPQPAGSCNSMTLLTAAPLHKLRPLPIGLDFHSLSQKAASGVVYRGMRASTAERQQAELDAIAASLPAFTTRQVKAYGSRWRALSKAAAVASPFAVNHTQTTPTELENAEVEGSNECCCPRARALKVFSAAPFTKHITIEDEELNRAELWRRHGRYSFVISPPGHGLDCHRTWEALALGCIPITLAPTPTFATATTDANDVHTCETGDDRQYGSSNAGAVGPIPDQSKIVGVSPHSGSWRNPLFNGLPVVVVQRWEDVTEDALHFWYDEYAACFDPSTPQGRALTNALHLEYWCNALH